MGQDTAPQKPGSFFMIGVIVGGLIAGLLVVFFGSEKGRRLVQKLQEEGLDFFEDAKEGLSAKVDEIEQKSHQLMEKGQELFEQGKALEEEVVDTVTEAKADLSEQVAEKVDSTLEHIERLQEHGRTRTAELRKRLFKNIPRRT